MQILPPKIFFFVLSPTSCPFCSPADEYPWWLWHASGWVVCCLSLWLGSIRFLRRMLFLSQNNTSLFPSMCPKKDKIIIHFPCVLWVDFHGMSYSGIGIFLPLLYTTWPVYLKQDISISVHGALALARRRLSLAPPPGGPRWVSGAGRELGESVRRERKWQAEGGRRLGGGVKKLHTSPTAYDECGKTLYRIKNLDDQDKIFRRDGRRTNSTGQKE